MFRIESYVTPILLSYVDKYVRDFKPADAQVSLWGGGVALHNLVLKADVLQQEVALPFKLVSGRIHELLIQVPWTKIMSEPIVVTIDTIECVLSLNRPSPGTDETPTQEPPRRETHVVEAPPGYMQALVRRIVSNISLRIHHLIVKYVQDDIVLSLNVKHLAIDSAGTDWEPTFADIDQTHPVVRRLVVLDDLTLCLDRADADGKIRFYQEPLLYRCQLDLRVLTRLVSPNTRRLSSLTVQLRSSKLAWGVTSDQLTLLFRLIRERTVVYIKPPTPAPKISGSNVALGAQLNSSTSNAVEPTRSGSWSEWAWSWLPTWRDREDVEEPAKTPVPIPIHFTAFFDEVSVVFKVMEHETKVRKRGRAVLELTAKYAAITSYICSPTTLRVRIGARDFTATSKGKCVCGHINFQTLHDQQTVYISKIKDDEQESEDVWVWPEDLTAEVGTFSTANIKPSTEPQGEKAPDTQDITTQMSDLGLPEEPSLMAENAEDAGSFWTKMSSIIFIEISHERTPPVADTNPYENPPTNFQYSDWIEEAMVKVTINPIEICVDMGLIHRLAVLFEIYRELPPLLIPDESKRVLTVEECEALSENLPQRRTTFEMIGWRLRMLPWDHSLTERPKAPPLFLDFEMPKNVVVFNGPLYPLRVCTAACQMPEDTGPVWQGARLHITVTLTSVRMAISAPNEKQSRHCGRADIKAVAHMLLNRQLFTKRESIHVGYSIKISEMNVCGSSPRLMAALQIPLSLFNGKYSIVLRCSSLPKDTLRDEDAVAIDVTLEDMVIRGYKTAHIITHILLLQTLKVTALHQNNRKGGSQAWLLSAPDNPSTSPFLRLAVQLCLEPVPFAFEYVGVWTEPTAVAIDPLFIAWLAYKPSLRPSESRSSMKTSSSTQFFMRRRGSTQSSSGRGASRSGSGADMIHMRTRSADSSDKTESKDKNAATRETEIPQLLAVWPIERLQALHERLKRMYINIELGLTIAYITMTTVSALDCATIRDAIERHASDREKVLAVSLGRIFIFSSTISKQFWHEIKHDGPTFKNKVVGAPEKESFPWKMRIADLACYTLEIPSELDKYEKGKAGLRSQLRTVCLAKPKTVLELVTSTVTLSTVTKSIQYIKVAPKPEQKLKTENEPVDEKLKYFKGGMTFKPTTLKEFVRGPAKRKKDVEEKKEVKEQEDAKPQIASGPIVSIGVHVHADTPPLILKLDQNQVQVVSASIHCLIHIVKLLNRPPIQASRHSTTSFSTPQRLLVRSLSEEHDSQSQSDTPSEERSGLISIYESLHMQTFDVKTFFCLQWVVSRISVVVISDMVKLSFNLEDIISTLDFQPHYNQLKIKVATAGVRHYQKNAEDEWVAEVIGGRVLVAREPSNAREDDHFMSVTITQAKISNLPEHWKQELHPKLLEPKNGSDVMWEVYATLAALESVIQPKLVKHLYALFYNMAPRDLCPLTKEHVTRSSDWQLPYLYLSAGGLRVLITGDKRTEDCEDTLILSVGKVTVTPHPENPICRRVVNSGPDTGWATGESYEGRQYEIYMKKVDICTAQFIQLVDEAMASVDMMTGVENPALKWSQSIASPVITPLLHAVDIGCVLAAAAFKGGFLVAGPAIELNIVSDCSLELNTNQLVLATIIMADIKQVLKESDEDCSEEWKWHTCPYSKIILTHTNMDLDTLAGISETTFTHAEKSTTPEMFRGVAVDSGIDSYSPGSHTKLMKEDANSNIKKTVSVVSFDYPNDPNDYIEIFVTMGTIAISLYTIDDGSPLVESLRPPAKWVKPVESETETPIQTPAQSRPDQLPKSTKKPDEKSGGSSVKEVSENDDVSKSNRSLSVTETVRDTDVGRMKLQVPVQSQARGGDGNLPLIHLSLNQPNLYFWRNKLHKNVQISLFDAWLCLGGSKHHNLWHEVVLSTARGVIDPVTDIPPALATLKIVIPSPAQSQSTISSRGTICLDLERPVQFEISVDRLRRIIAIHHLLKEQLHAEELSHTTPEEAESKHFMHKFRGAMVLNSVESITIQTTQISLVGLDGAFGWDSASFQVGAGGRPDRLIGRALISALVISADPPGDTRHMVLQPLTFGLELEATWEAWRKTEGIAYREPMIRVTLELDRVTLDLRPADMETIGRLKRKIQSLLKKEEEIVGKRKKTASTSMTKNASTTCVTFEDSTDSESNVDEHFYKDDLRSGAFKLVSGGQLPMAYQVTLHRDAVSWRYPHPRAITRLVAFPLPGQDKETPCVLELFNTQLNRWEKHTYFSIPVGEPVDICLYVPPPDAIFSVMWRYRACFGTAKEYSPFEFSINKFQPRSDPLYNDPPPDIPTVKYMSDVSAEQLSGVVRVDSCFSPRLTPRVSFVTRIANFALHLHNAPPNVASQATYLEGYYVSKPLMRSHRVLTLAAQDATVHAQLASPAGSLILVQTDLASDCLDCTTGTMEQLIRGFHAECGLSLPSDSMSRARLTFSDVHVALHVPRLRTLHALLNDWRSAVKLFNCSRLASTEMPLQVVRTKREIAEVTAATLEGRISLWVHNTCGSALRVGQEGTDEVVPLGPGISLAYRWRSPTAKKQLRFALVGPTTDWHWSTSVPFVNIGGPNRVRLQDAEIILGNVHHAPGVYLYTSVEEIGSRLSLKLSGRLCLANMLRFHLLYKVRARGNERQWRTINSGEIPAETVGNSVICGSDTDMALKIKFSSSDTGWSGDIPLRECPKENVPWLVKVPCIDDTPFMSVWCRVVRGRNDGRILATIWPLYVLYSHLPLDTDVLISTKCDQASSESVTPATEPTPLIQTAPGRGTSTHLIAPGTTSARHTLSFQYRSINCPVTREAVPLHYGVTFTSVFEKRPSVSSIEDVLQEINEWIKRCSHEVVSGWPYSIVMKHWPFQWQAASMQPRCDVVVHYQAVRAGGGCSLEVQLCPVVLLCNAAPISLTLRAHDAAPLCKVEPGCAIAPPSVVLSKPFFISMEIGRETFVSGELSVSGAELGRYGTTPHGRVALDRPAELTIQCGQKVALLTMYYEIKEDINVLGLSTTYVLINKTEIKLSISPVAVPGDANEDTAIRPTTFKVVAPSEKNTNYLGKSLCRFMMVGRWRGSDPNELRLYLFVGLSDGGSPVRATPIRLGFPPVRRAIALTDDKHQSVPVVVTQVHHEGRWVISVGPDPCPQFIIHNRTFAPLAVAQPAQTHEEPTTSKVTVQQECPGTRWYCVVYPEAVTHYSTPAHCLRYPPPNNSPQTTNPSLTFLTFATAQDAGDLDWCSPVAVTDGEQLIQLTSGMTVKLRVRTHPHTTHLELRGVDKSDISASDIRKRLLGPFASQVFGKEKSSHNHLERTYADEQLFRMVGEDQISRVVSFSSGPKVLSTTDEDEGDEQDERQNIPSALKLLPENGEDALRSRPAIASNSKDSEASNVFKEVSDPEWEETASWSGSDRLRVVAASVALDLAQTGDTLPLVAIYLDRPSIIVHADARRTKTSISINDVQVDNLQYESGQFDFGVVATTRDGDSPRIQMPCLWSLFADVHTFTNNKEGKALLKLTHDSWKVLHYHYTELTEVDVNVGPMALYIEDAYVTSVARLWRRAVPPDTSDSVVIADERALQRPLTLRLLHIHPLDLTLTLHTAVRMYIALDQSPLRLSAFKLQDTMTSPEWLTHALTVHYLSAAILGAGWVVGGLELLGAPGALAARVGGARGGVRGVASAAAAALLRSLSAWAGSLARNLDLLAGDEEHARRAAAARRKPPTSFMAGLATGITNFAINILGAVGGLAHHPLVGVAVGESDSSATALRRGILGALAKPLSATADLVAFAGHGLLTQTGWDPVPQPRSTGRHVSDSTAGWRRDCVRWSFRLAELTIFVGFHVLLDSTPLLLLLTHKFLVVTDPDWDRIVEMIDFKFCSIGPYQGQIIELVVSQKHRQSRSMDTRGVPDEDDEYQISAAAMARVARYTGAENTTTSGETRVLSLLPAPSHAYALHAALTVAVHYNTDSHFKIL